MSNTLSRAILVPVNKKGLYVSKEWIYFPIMADIKKIKYTIC